MPAIDAAQSSGKPLVSIVMSHWDSLLFVRETLESIAAQTFLDGIGEAEFIMYDDGSPPDQLDALRRIVAGFQDRFSGRFAKFSGVHTVSHNMGKNRVLEQTKPHISDGSRYTVVADSDDVYDPDFLTVHFRHLEEQRALNPNVVMTYSDNILIDKNGVCCGTGNAPSFDRDVYFERDNYKGENYIPGYALVVTERFLKGVPRDLDTRNRDKQLRHMAELGDNGIAVHIGFLNDGDGTANNIAGRHVFYRQHETQMSGHMDQLGQDPRYGEGGFFARWPEDLPKPHWREFVNLPRETKIGYLAKMPRADTQGWNRYSPRGAAPIR